MKLILASILSLALAFVAGFYLPWWAVAASTIPSVLIFNLKGLERAIIGFGAGFLSWFVTSWIISNANDHVLSGQLNVLFFGTDTPLFIPVSSLLGGIISLIGALLGGSIQRLFRN